MLGLKSQLSDLEVRERERNIWGALTRRGKGPPCLHPSERKRERERDKKRELDAKNTAGGLKQKQPSHAAVSRSDPFDSSPPNSWPAITR